MKLILLGTRGAGKSTIVRALRDLPYREGETSTPGVALCDWTLEGTGEEPVTVHVWDFSGQPVTHALHPFFFSPRNLYLLVLSGRDHHERDDAEYWLRMVEAHGTDSHGQGPAVIVAMIIMLIFVNQISDFVDRHPTIKMLALSFLILIGSMLVAEGFHQHIPKGYIYFAMAFSVVVEMLNIRTRKKAQKVELHQPYR